MTRARRQRKRSRKQKTVGVSAIQARLINAQNEVKTKTETDEWETCKERVSVERSKILMKYNEDVDAVKSIESTFEWSASTPGTSHNAQTVTRCITEPSHSLISPKRIKPLFLDQPSSSELDMVMENLDNNLKIGQVRKVVLHYNSRKLAIFKNDAWEKCKERVRAEKERLSNKMKQ